MKRFLKSLIIFPVYFLFCLSLTGAVSTAEANGKWGSLNLLKKVHSHSMGNGQIIRLEFNKPVADGVEPVFYEKSVQIDIQGAFVEPAKKSFSDTEGFLAENSLVAKVFASQYDGETLRIRFHIKPGTDNIESRFKLVTQGRFMIVRFDTANRLPSIPASVKTKNKNDALMDADELSRFLSRASKKIRIQEELPTAHSYVATIQEQQPKDTEIKVKRAGMGLVPLVNQIKKAAISDTEDKKVVEDSFKPKKENKMGFSLKDSRKNSRPAGKPLELVPSGLKMLSMLALVLGLMFLLFFGFKKYVLKNTAFGGGNKLVQVLGTGFLGPKKNIALVEVAGEVLVLGISQENITLLSSITDEEKIEEIKIAGGKGGSGLSWNPVRSEKQTGRTPSAAAQVAGQFSSYLNKFSKNSESKEQPLVNAKEQILQKIGRMKTAKA